MTRDAIAKLERFEPEKLELRAAFYSAQAKEADPVKQIAFIMLACEARRYAANLRAMRAARLRTAML